ncbi:unannotated protein [freshwater metagenome]|uniref:Unannotated protein n=1 Tax=freshwater metagenome TaxID=449393 RepID=A0A6J7VXB0_9ZZZZ
MERATSLALAVPLNLSTAARTRTEAVCRLCDRVTELSVGIFLT